jgi:type I restriction enzyme, S subunit
MNAERLLAHCEKIADAPDAIARLRRFILDLAVRGKLVPQDANDEPASELLKRIAKKKARLVKAGEIRKSQPLPAIDADDLPFELPKGWAWTRLGNVIHLVSGQHLQPSEYSEDQEAGLPYITGPSDFGADGLEISRFALVRKAVAKKGQLLLTVKGSGVGKATICDIPEVAISRQLMALTAIEWNDRFLLLITHRLAEKLQAEARSLIPGISREDVDEFVVPLPPLAEQHRIVAKVDELMALCDRLEAARAGREGVRDRLAAASLGRVNAPDPETFQADARFALDALPALTTRPDQIERLRQTILNLAVRGRLVPQDPNDEPASELLKRIAKEKARLVKAGAIPAKKELVRDPSRLTDELPASWSPIALGSVCNLVTSGSRGWAEFYSTSGSGFIRAQNIRFGKLRLDDLAFVNPPSNSEGSRTQVAKGDLLIVITGAGVTNPALLDHDPGEAYVSQHVGLVRPSDQQLSAWMLLCLMADAGGRAELVERAYGAGKPGLNLDNIRSLSIPLPPLAEQHRIVAKVDALMALCDRLEASLTATATTRRRLLDALLAEALAPPGYRELEAAE